MTDGSTLLDRITAGDNIQSALLEARKRLYLRDRVKQLVASGASGGWLADLKTDLSTLNYVPTLSQLRSLSHADDGSRSFTCEVLDLRDWVAQRAILVPLRRFYRQKRAAETAVANVPLVAGQRDLVVRAERALALGRRWFAYADVQDFFGSIDVDRLSQEVALETSEPAVAALIQRCVSGRRGLPRGHVLSPFLSNVYLLPVDRRASLLPWFRYADDMFLHRNNRSDAESALAELEIALSLRGLMMHPRKRLVVDWPNPTRLLELRLQ